MKKRTAVTILLNIFFILLVLVIILPAAWLIMNSLKTNVELFTDSLALPAKVQFANYISAWNKGLYKYFGNSVIVSSISLISILFLSSLLAYGITRFNSRFGNLIFLITLGGMALSEQVALVPLYKILQATHLYNTYWAVILPYVAFRIPFTVFLMRAYFMCIPKELEEAAIIDGANHFITCFRVYVPCAKPSIATLTLFSFITQWNSYFDGLIFSNFPSSYPLASYLYTVVVKRDLSLLSIDEIKILSVVDDRTIRCAQIFISLIPIMLIYPFAQKYFVKGMTVGSVKG